MLINGTWFKVFFVKFARSFCKFQAAAAQELILGEHQISYLKEH